VRIIAKNKKFDNFLRVYFLGRVPAQVGLAPFCFGSGYALQVLTCFASCGLSAAIPHAKTR